MCSKTSYFSLKAHEIYIEAWNKKYDFSHNSHQV